MSYNIPSMRLRGIEGAVVTVTKARTLTVAELDARAAVCAPCEWNHGDRCQHPGQRCPPCKQGLSLSRARAAVNFRCPLKLFPKL
jgi:predicted Zn-ribbon and HTH transcriptional regulator